MPRICRNLEYYLSTILGQSESRKLINDFMSKFISSDNDIFTKLLHSFKEIEEFSEIIYNQTSYFIRYFIEETSNELNIDHIDKSLTDVLKESVMYLLNIEPNTKGLEYALIDSRREFRMNRWLINYEKFREFSDIILLDIEKIRDNYVPALLFQLSKSIEELINNVQEYRARGIVNLIYIDSEYRLLKRTDNLSNAIAKLTLDQTSKTGILIFNKYANLIDRRSAQRVAHSIVKMGFIFPDKSRTGMNYVLEIMDTDFY